MDSTNIYLEQLKRKSDRLGVFSPISHGISLFTSNPFGERVKYKISKNKFDRNINKIIAMLTMFHETTHFIRFCSTTYGLFQSIIIGNYCDALFKLITDTEYNLPIDDYFQEIFSKKNKFEAFNDPFINLYMSHLYSAHFLEMLDGTLPLNSSSSNNKELVLETEIIDIYKLNSIRTDNNKNDHDLFSMAFPVCLNRYNENCTLEHGFGLLHLEEAFCQSLEFEHIYNFNEKVHFDIANKWFNNDRLFVYNTAARIMESFLRNSDWDNVKRSKFKYPLAHLRIFIDISSMYSDLLNKIDVFRQRDDRKYMERIVNETVHPGITFINVLKAFIDCDPLSDFGDDTIRLYNEICLKINIPSLEQMLLSLRFLIREMINSPYYQLGLLNNNYLRTSLKIVEDKIKNPVKYINGIINPDNFSQVYSLIKDDMHINGTHLFNYETYLIDAFLKIFNQIKSQTSVKCPITKDCQDLSKEEDIRDCVEKGTSDTHHKLCYLGSLLSQIKY